jgi:diacylglycerol O-acyltransferase-1
MLLAVSVQTLLVPVVLRSPELLISHDVLYNLERLLTMAVPSICSWLLAFYVFFHLYLNIIAELTYFGDRNFYEDWWTSRDVGTFWRKWNKPVHNFLKTQVYSPLVFIWGMNKFTAQVFVFFFSAVAHELAVSVPLRTFDICQLHSFGGMMFQLPLVLGTQLLPPRFGNYVFWLSIMIGQPAGVLMYYHDFINTHGPPGAAFAAMHNYNSSMIVGQLNMTEF